MPQILAVSLGPTFDHWTIAVWFWATCLIGLIWLKRHIDLNRGRSEPILTPDEPGLAESDLPELSVLVAAKDEEKNIGRCAEGLLAQQYPRLQIVLIDDRSDDETPKIIDGCAQKDQRLTALHVTELPAGWFGKNNAMRVGVENATGEWLCFSDADCAYDSPHLLTSAVRFAVREQADFLSVLPRLEAGTFWEKVIQPVAGAIMVFWFPPQKVNSPTSTRAYANGAFMLMPRTTYDALGGHEPVKATLNEDMHLARRSKAAGLRLKVIRGGDLYRVRMYVGFKQIWRGWSRIFYGCFGTWPRLLGSFLMLAIFSVSPYLTLLLAGSVGSAGAWLFGASAFAVLAQQSVLWRFYAVTGNRPAWALSYPLGAAVCLAMTVNAMRRLFGASTTWRGTSYTGGARTTSESTNGA